MDDVCLSGCRYPRLPHRPETQSCLTASGPGAGRPLRGGRKAERVGHVWVGRVLGEALGPATRSRDPWEERREQGRPGACGKGRWGQAGAGRWGRVAAVLGALPLRLIGPLSSPDVATLRLPLKQPSPLLLPAPGLAGDPAGLPLPPPPHTCPFWQELPGRNYQQHQGGRHPGRPLCPRVLRASLLLGALPCPHCSPRWVNRRTAGPLAITLCAFLKWFRVLVKRNNILEHARSGCSQLWSPIQSIQQPRDH